MGNLTFEKEGHIYKLDGCIIPSVSQVIQAAGLSGLDRVPAELLERNAAFGNAVHKAVELKCKGTLDISSVDEAIKPYLEQWDKFCTDYCYKSHQQEYRACNQALRVGFCIDNIGYIKTVANIVDVKTGVPKPADIIQACGYGYLYPVSHVKIVYLTGGTYKVHDIKGQERRQGQQIFLSCLSLYNWKKEKRLL